MPENLSRPRWLRTSLSALLLLSSGMLLACSPDASELDPSSIPPVMKQEEPLSYHRDAKAMVQRYCNDCHSAGGIAPFTLTSYADVKAHAPQIRAAVNSGSMPPWMPSDQGVALRNNRSMPAEHRAALLRWIDEGSIEGPSDAVSRPQLPPAEPVQPPRPDLVMDSGYDYLPNSKLQDDYRCFIVDPKLTEDRYVQASDITPGNAQIVHHVILFEVPEKDATRIRQKDKDEAGPGYTCFGGAGSNNASFVVGWAPGGVPNRLRADEGVLLRKGSLLVMQVHYNLLQYKGVGDRTKATLELAPSKPPYRVLLVPMANPNELKIPAGDPNAKQTLVAPIAIVLRYLGITAKELVLTGTTPHMHMLGKSIYSRIEDGPMLLEIPHWDFHWQQGYHFKEPIALRPTDSLMMECAYDNSYANQPVVNGQKQMPREVTWGEGTLDEMCLSFMHLRIPQPATP